jgi:hypothetical protein
MSETPGTRDTPDRALGPPRFSLRALLVVTALCGGLFALMSLLGAMWSMGLLLIGGLVLAHVLGNLLGTRLRDGTKCSREPGNGYDDGPPPTSRRAHRTRLSPAAAVLSALGGTLGALLGGLGSVVMYPGTGGLVLGVLSGTVLGTLLGFIGSRLFLMPRAGQHDPPCT